MEQEVTALDMVDLYEEMLDTRAANGVRPVLYASSRTDLACSVLMLLNEELETKLAGLKGSKRRGSRNADE